MSCECWRVGLVGPAARVRPWFPCNEEAIRPEQEEEPPYRAKGLATNGARTLLVGAPGLAPIVAVDAILVTI